MEFINILFMLFFQMGATPIYGLPGVTTAAFQAPARIQAEGLGLVRQDSALRASRR